MMQHKENEKKYSALRVLPFGLLGLYFVLSYLLNLSRTIEFVILGAFIVISSTVVLFLLKKGAIDQPKKRLTMAAVAIASGGVIFIVYLFFINSY